MKGVEIEFKDNHAVIKVFRVLTYREVREVFETLGGSNRRLGTTREAAEAELREVARPILTGHPRPWSLRTWQEEIAPAWEALGHPKRAGSSLLKRYRRMRENLGLPAKAIL